MQRTLRCAGYVLRGAGAPCRLRRSALSHSAPAHLRRVAAPLCTPFRSFGNAPSRIRPVETPQEHAWRQSEREMSPTIVIVIMFITPLWLFVLSAESQETKRDAVRSWALEQRAAHRPVENPADK